MGLSFFWKEFFEGLPFRSLDKIAAGKATRMRCPVSDPKSNEQLENGLTRAVNDDVGHRGIVTWP